MSSSDAAERSLTYWEEAAQTRWGKYLTEHEFDVLVRAAVTAGDPGNALDVGCEGGRWSKLLADRGWEMTCIDIDEEALAICAARIPSARCAVADPNATSLPAGDGSLRLLLVFEVPAVVQADWFPREAARVLVPGGVVVLTYHNPRSLRGIAYALLRHVDQDRASSGAVFYSGASYSAFRRRLQDAGFRFLEERGLAWAPFKRRSDSVGVVAATAVEGALMLRRLPTLSPLVVASATRVGTS